MKLTVELLDGFALIGQKDIVGKSTLTIPDSRVGELITALRRVAAGLEIEACKTLTRK